MIKKLSLFFIFCFCTSMANAAKTMPPPPSNYIYDEAHLFNTASSTLSSQLAEEDQKYGNQILIAVFKSLEGEEYIDFTNRLFSKWKPGQKENSNGLLIAIYLQDRKLRIEVGYGLEHLLTDAKSKQIISEILQPAFRSQQYDQGMLAAVQQIRKIIHSEKDDLSTPTRTPQRKRPPSFLLLLFFGVAYLIFYLFDRFTPQTLTSSRRNGLRGSGWGGGGFGGGGFGGGSSGDGGGGFLGGGGMSGGGGASGDW